MLHKSSHKLDSERHDVDIGNASVPHSLVTFDDGNKEPVMAVYKYKDGKIISLETGATKLSK